MRKIPASLNAYFSTLLNKSKIPKRYQNNFKCLRYYLDFCHGEWGWEILRWKSKVSSVQIWFNGWLLHANHLMQDAWLQIFGPFFDGLKTLYFQTPGFRVCLIPPSLISRLSFDCNQVDSWCYFHLIWWKIITKVPGKQACAKKYYLTCFGWKSHCRKAL